MRTMKRGPFSVVKNNHDSDFVARESYRHKDMIFVCTLCFFKSVRGEITVIQSVLAVVHILLTKCTNRTPYVETRMAISAFLMLILVIL